MLCGLAADGFPKNGFDLSCIYFVLFLAKANYFNGNTHADSELPISVSPILCHWTCIRSSRTPIFALICFSLTEHFLPFQLAISQTPGTLAASLIGLIAGQLYRSDILGLKAFRLPRYLRRFASRFLLPLIGSTKPPRRPNRAFPPDDTSSTSPSSSPPSGTSTSREENTEVITTAPVSAARRPQENDRTDQSRTRSSGSSSANAQTSVVREWVDEFTGRAERAASGLRVPSDNEINQLMSMFPDLRREVIVGALQRRCVEVWSLLPLLR